MPWRGRVSPLFRLLLGVILRLKVCDAQEPPRPPSGSCKIYAEGHDTANDVGFETTARQFKVTLGLTHQHEGSFGLDLRRQNWLTMPPVKYYQSAKKDDKLESAERKGGRRRLLAKKQ